jgi:molybdenum cofactor biosynthesis enzyme MoaA
VTATLERIGAPLAADLDPPGARGTSGRDETALARLGGPDLLRADDDGFRPALREGRQALFAVGVTSSGARLLPLEIGGRRLRVYENANLSIYSAERCNARCPFCVEELRPLSRGVDLAAQRRVEADDARYFAALERALEALRPLDPSVSITGGEPSRDPRLPRILETIARAGARKRTMTTNASGLLEPLPGGGDVLERVLAAGLAHLNVSRADPDERENQRIMRIEPFHPNAALAEVLRRARDAGVRPRLSCVLLKGRADSIEACERYLGWAASLGVDNVVFRQLMRTDASTVKENLVTRFSDARRAALAPILEAIRPATLGPREARRGWRFTKQVTGYYYYVEVYRYEGASRPVDVVLEEADLAWIERRRRAEPADVVHELVFHPDGALSSSWQPWDGVLIRAPGDARGG